MTVNGSSGTLSLFKNNSSTGNILFSPKMDFTTGSFPFYVVAGDLDGDGKQDIVVVNNSSNSISIFKNNSIPGTISFAPKNDLAAGNGPTSVAIMDLDGDGRPELIVTNGNAGTVSVFKNTSQSGSLSFASKQDFNTGTNPQGVAVADLDGDGKPDLVIANGSASTISILQNNGSFGMISFTPKIDFGTGGITLMVSIADMDGDGKPDLVFANNSTPGVTMLRNLSTAGVISLSPNTFGIAGISPSFCIAIGDIDGDGKPDVISANSSGPVNSNIISVCRNTSITGQFSFASNVNYSVGTDPWFVDITDLDGDGMPDLETANSASNTVSILRNTVSPLAIFSFTPATAGKDTSVTITGKGFTGVTSVSFGGIPADSFTVVSPTSIIAYVGAGATGAVSVLTSTATATLGGFTFIPSPTITSFTPNSGGPGATIIIQGTNLTGATAIRFGGSLATSFSVQSPSTIQAVVGNGASGNISVTTAGGTSSLAGFTFSTVPTISSFSPDTTGIGSTVTILGTNFWGVSGVNFGGIAASSFTVVSYDTIKAVVGPGANGNLSITNGTDTASAPGFVFNSTPVINAFSPDTAGDGSVITLTGHYFLGTTSVSFGGIPASSFTVISEDSIKAEVGVGASGNVAVTTQYGTGQLGGFLFTSKPAITYFTPTAGGQGTQITIYGINLNNTISVSIGGKAASFTVVSASELTAIVSIDSTGTVPISINTSLGTASVGGFYLKPINIISFNPLSGPAGSTVTISGNHFSVTASHNKVYFGAVQANVTGATSGSIIVTVPPGATYKPLSVTNTDNNLTAYAAQPFITTFTGDSGFTANSFTNAGSLIGGNYPSSLFLSDLDGDGKPDLIVANINGNSFSVFRNISTTGTISFAPKSDFATGLSPYKVVAADLDGDGKQDLVIENLSGNSVSIFKNTSSVGVFTFAPALTYSFTSPPSDICIGDLNGDGKPDLIIGLSEVDVLKNTSVNGNISFAAAINYQTTISINNMIAGDFDGDGKPDLAVADYSDSAISILQNISTSVDSISFSPKPAFPTPGSPTSISIGDLDGDGMSDLATSSDLAAVVSTYRNMSGNRTISFAPNKNYATGIYANDVAIGDLNGDGKPDLVSANNQVSSVSIFKNESQIGTISFSGKTDYSAGLGPQNVVIGDLDGDGKPDMAVTNYIANTITLLRNTENDSLAPRINSFLPDSGVTGTKIIISGVHFTGASAVGFGGMSASSFTVESDSSITGIVGMGSSGNVSISTPDGTCAIGGFKFIPATVDSVFKLIQFSGKLVNARVQLEWQSSNEQNIVEYYIEYSKDSLQFLTIDSVQKSGIGNYTYTDLQHPDSNNYFRLKIVDTSRNFIYSKVINLPLPVMPIAMNGIVLRPNPAKGTVEDLLSGFRELF